MLNFIINFIINLVAQRQARIQARRDKLYTEMLGEVQCKDVQKYPSFLLVGVQGRYSDGKILLNSKSIGLNLIDTMYHEDRHYQQDKKGLLDNITYIQPDEDVKAYYAQRCEYDARRYAYVKTCRFLQTNYPEKKFVLFIYTLVMKPVTGLNYRYMNRK